MKLLDVLGTSSETFSVGLGEKKVELRTVDGVLHFRNFGGGWEEASSASVKESLRPRSYVPGLALAEKELFVHSGSLWYTEVPFTASSFLLDASKVTKVVDLNNFTSLNVAQYVNTNVALSAETSDQVYVFGSTSGASFIRLYLPPANTLQIGRHYDLINTSEVSVQVYRSGDTSPLLVVQPNQKAFFFVTTNTNVGGTWYTFNYSSGGGGGGGGSSAIVVTLDLGQYGGVNPFGLGNVVTYNPLSSPPKWEKATSTNYNLGSVGVVTTVASLSITVTFLGEVDVFSDLTVGSTYYLSDTSPGNYTDSRGTYNVPLFVATSQTKGVLLSASDSDNRFNKRTLLTLNVDQEYTLTLPGKHVQYEGYVLSEPRYVSFKATCYPGSPPSVIVETFSSYVTDTESDGFLCFVDKGSNVVLKNKLQSTVTLLLFVRGY